MKKIFLGLIKLYQELISPFLPSCCRFYPTCSQYASEAIERFGPFKGGILILWRLLRCQPFSRGGYDPVPQSFPWSLKKSFIKGASLWKRI